MAPIRLRPTIQTFHDMRRVAMFTAYTMGSPPCDEPGFRGGFVGRELNQKL
ncbi:MAG: hypothetical protein OXG05_01130 [Gammaproteobacteria bacterium]|nr:hypothetical protein [Gammaproteobacteria bacterium]